MQNVGERMSERSIYGTSIMGLGNTTYGKEKTYLTHASAAILNNCQVFANDKDKFYDKKPTAELQFVKTSLSRDGKMMTITGGYKSDIDVVDVSYWHDPEPQGGYYTVAWADGELGSIHDRNLKKFKISMDIDKDLSYKGDNQEYMFYIALHHKNGYNSWFKFYYKMENGKANVANLNLNRFHEHDKTGWKVIDFSSQESNSWPGLAEYAIDKLTDTKWMSQWSQSPEATYPHYITVDMGQSLLTRGFVFNQYKNSKIKYYEIFVSDDALSWRKFISNTLVGSINKQSYVFGAMQRFRYFKFVAKSPYDGQNYAAISEIGVLGEKEIIHPGEL